MGHAYSNGVDMLMQRKPFEDRQLARKNFFEVRDEAVRIRVPAVVLKNMLPSMFTEQFSALGVISEF